MSTARSGPDQHPRADCPAPRLPRAFRARLARVWARREWPGSSLLLGWAGAWDDRPWAGLADSPCRGKWHGYALRIDLREFHQRAIYFYGRTLDMPVLLCVRALLRPGDALLDVGANIGVVSLLAAWAVGPAGAVVAFEPNPDIYARLRQHIDANGLTQIDARPDALSDHEGVMPLRVPANNCGAATLGAVPRRYGPLRATHEVRLRVGDTVDLGRASHPTLVKLDVEGHETRVLRGLEGLLARERPAVLLECNPEMLPRNGTSPGELLSLMEGHGYRAHAVDALWRRLRRRWDLTLTPIGPGWEPAKLTDLLFLRPGSEQWERVRSHIVGDAR